MIPNTFQNRIITLHGSKGERWLESLPLLVDYYTEKWNLANVTISPELYYNLIMFADSPQYGEVVLKAGVPNPEILIEAKTLQIYNGRHACKCYEFDPENFVMLLERIIPGYNLTSFKSLEDRLRIAADIIKKLPLPAADTSGLPFYSVWLNRAFRKVKHTGILPLIKKAEKLFAEIESKNLPHFVLHGDLHHKNILYSSEGQWKIIDPKGVTAHKCFEAARFIDNEFEIYGYSGNMDKFKEMLLLLCNELDEPFELIFKCAFIDKVLSICWSIEDGEDREVIEHEVREVGRNC
jgi:streptomycin 6-kinase